MAEMELFISIIVPVYNVQNELPRCIHSLINQTYNNIEIILIDDGSTDECPEMCDEYAKTYSKITVIHKNNGGLSDARNDGLREAIGDYILFVDSDDYVNLDTCERFAYLAKKYLPDIVVGEALQYDGKKKTIFSRSCLVENHIYNAKEFIIKSADRNEWYAPVCFNLYNRKYLNENNIFFRSSILHEDMEILPKITLPASSIVYMKTPFYNYIIRENSITKQKNQNKNMIDLQKIFTDWKLNFDSIGDRELRRSLYCCMSKHYLHVCRVHKNFNNMQIPGVTKFFLIKYSFNFRERIKAIIFSICPSFYVNL